MFFFFFLEKKENNYFFFFFQAEDGIRDFHVTGVQTCALPILAPERSGRPGASERHSFGATGAASASSASRLEPEVAFGVPSASSPRRPSPPTPARRPRASSR